MNSKLASTLWSRPFATALKRNIHVHVWHDAKQAVHTMSSTRRTMMFLMFMIPFPVIFGEYLEDSYVAFFWNETPHYLRRRTKPFPWFCYDCGLFELECKEKCMEEEHTKRSLYEAYMASKQPVVKK
jgi:hypothetical protein